MADDLSTDVLARVAAGEFGPTGGLGTPFEYHGTIDSTNRRALEWAAEGAPPGALVVADRQTAGRGRRGRSWLAPAGSALLMSVVVDRAAARSTLTTALGVAVTEAIAETSPLDLGIKWPNDVWCNGRKLGGILVEATSGPGRDSYVAGIGVNVDWKLHDMPPELRGNATSLVGELGGPPPDRASVLASVLRRISEVTTALADGDVGAVVERARELSIVVGQEVDVLLHDGRTLHGIAVGLAESGELEVDVGGGVRRLSAGEITRLRPV